MKHGRIHRLGHVQVEACGQGPLPVLLLSIARDGDQPDIARLGPRTGHAGQLVAIHTRKAHVDQRDVRMELAELGEPLRSVARGLDDMYCPQLPQEVLAYCGRKRVT